MEYFELIIWNVSDLQDLEDLCDWDEYADCVWDHSHYRVATSINKDKLIELTKSRNEYPMLEDHRLYKDIDCEHFFTIQREFIDLEYVDKDIFK